MAKYLTKFADQAAYDAGTKQYPNVSLLDDGTVIYMAEAPNKVKLKYLNGDVVLVECDGTGIVTSGEVANKSNVVEAIFGECITTIGGAILTSDRNLSAVTIPEGVTTIERFAFTNTALASINLPNTITTIANNAFSETNITSIAFPSGITAISDGVCDTCAQLRNVVFSDNITTIGAQAFYCCGGLTSITLPSSLRTIARGAFAYTGIESVDFPLGTMEIRGFDGCASLTSATIPSSVTKIKESCFEQCQNLREIDIPSSVTTIEGWAFDGCSDLQSITCRRTTPPTLGNNKVFNGSTCPIYVPAESVEAYKAASRWSSYASRIQAIPNS